MLVRSILVTTLLSASFVSAISENMKKCLTDNTQLKQLKDFIELKHPDLFKADGKTSSSGIIGYPAEGQGHPFGTICFSGKDGNTTPDLTRFFYVDPQDSAKKYTSFCPVPSVTTEKALCKYKDMSVTVGYRLTPLKFQSCAMSTCKVTKTKLTSTTKKIQGDLKIAPTIFKKLGLEATITGSLENVESYTEVDEQGFAKNESAIFFGVVVEVKTFVGSVSISEYDKSTFNPSTKTFDGPCREDSYTSTEPSTNTYLLGDTKQTQWISCDAYYPKRKRSLDEDTLWDLCLDANFNIVECD